MKISFSKIKYPIHKVSMVKEVIAKSYTCKKVTKKFSRKSKIK